METTLRLTMKNGDFLTGGYTRMELELEEFGYPDPYVETVIHDGRIYKVVDLHDVIPTPISLLRRTHSCQNNTSGFQKINKNNNNTNNNNP